MKHEYAATVAWTSDGTPFASGKYSRAHTWTFDGGIVVPASSSPLVVRVPYSREDAVDPEEAFVASVSSCHMLTFLYVAAKRGVVVTSYVDHAVGTMKPNADKRMAVTDIVLRPRIEYAGEPPTREVLDALHHAAHEECFIANSIKTVVTVEHVEASSS